MTLRLSTDEQNLVLTYRRLRQNNQFMKLATATAPAKTFATRKEIKAGGGFPCLLGCGKVLRTLDRSKVHVTTNAELQLRGHIAK